MYVVALILEFDDANKKKVFDRKDKNTDTLYWPDVDDVGIITKNELIMILLQPTLNK